MVRRKKNEEGQTQYGKIQRDIFIPMIVLFYNLYMGAVDLFDQYRSYIKLELRSGKFWHPMMWFIFESALVNLWVLYKCIREKAGLQVQYNFGYPNPLNLLWLQSGKTWDPDA